MKLWILYNKPCFLFRIIHNKGYLQHLFSTLQLYNSQVSDSESGTADCLISFATGFGWFGFGHMHVVSSWLTQEYGTTLTDLSGNSITANRNGGTTPSLMMNGVKRALQKMGVQFPNEQQKKGVGIYSRQLELVMESGMGNVLASCWCFVLARSTLAQRWFSATIPNPLQCWENSNAPASGQNACARTGTWHYCTSTLPALDRHWFSQTYTNTGENF